MHKTINSLLAVGLLVSMLLTPQAVHAQISFPAEMNKAFSPTSIASGAKSRLSVTIFNPNPFALTNATWTDNFPAGITVANPVNLTNSCGGTVTAVPGGTSLSLSGGTAPAQVGATPGSCTVAIDVTSTTPGNLVNTIPAGSLSTANNVTTTSPASATLNVVGSQAPTVSKSFNPVTIWAGQTSRLTINVRNNDPAVTLTQASLVDNLPANVFLATPVNPTLSSCGAATLTAVSGGTSVTLGNATIAPNSTCTITVNVTSTVQGVYDNTIPANALQTQQNLTNATPATARLNVDLIGIFKGFSPPTIAPGGTSTLTITLQNPTGSAYTGVNVTDNLPSPLTVAGTPTTTCGGSVTSTSTSVTLTGGTIPPGTVITPGTCTISVPVTAPAGTSSGSFRNTIPAGALTTAQGVGNPRPAVADLTIAGTDVRGTKSFIPNTITAGGNSRMRIDIIAPGDTDLHNFSITDNLPPGVTVSNSSPPIITGCGAAPPRVLTAPTGATSISLTNGLILAGQHCIIEVFVTSSVTGVHTNSIPPGNITNTENRTTTGSFSSNLTVTGAGNLAIDIVKDFNPLLVAGGASSTMSILLINPESVPLTGIGFTDTMPVGMILANPVNPNVGTCGGTLTGTAGSNSFSFSGGSLPAGGTCTLTLSATITVNGNLTNTIPASAVTTNEGATNPDPTSATLTNLPGASISKAFAPNPIAAGSFSLLTITIQNTGSIALTGMGLIDNLPAGLVVAGPPAPASVNNCGGTFSTVVGASAVQLTNGVLAGNSSCTIVVSVTGGTPGVYDNTIPAGALITDPALNTTNTSPATATLTITGGPGGGGGGGTPINEPPDAVASSFIIPLTGFAPGRETKLDASSRPVYDSTTLLLDIPVLKVKAPIVGVESRDGRWDVSWLQRQVGWLNGSAYPTWKGNSLLTGHVVNADGKPGVFSNLKALGVGEYIFVYNSGYRYTYQVVSNGFVQPNDSRVMKHEEKSYLTLITCDTYNERTATYLRRVVVRAVLVDVAAVK